MEVHTNLLFIFIHMDFFTYNNRTNILEFNEYQILLVREFAKLYEPTRNKCKEDITGVKRLLAKREFIYMWLKINKKSPYYQYAEQDAQHESLKDSGLSDKEYDDPDFRSACKKYLEIRDSNKIAKMLRILYNKVDEISDYYETMDFQERDANGKPIFKLKEFQIEIKNMGDLLAGLKSLELQYGKEEETKSNLRADATAGFKD